jgi:aspartate kinase
MLVFKFGGASVKDVASVQNIHSIIEAFSNRLVIVVSAMGKTTNALEKVCENYFNDSELWRTHLDQIKDYHLQIANGLIPDKTHPIFSDLEKVFNNLENKLLTQASLNYDFEYDQIVSQGEILSTLIVSAYLNYKGLANTWLDIRRILRTDSTFRDGKVNFDLSGKMAQKYMSFEKTQIYVTQGFIASDVNNASVTLGREGSDYTAAILAHLLDAESVTIWKDVPGVLNADPKFFDKTIKINHLSYLDAIELTYYGASVIHPKTIKPLQNKNIPLHVKSFIQPKDEGTVIGNFSYDASTPSFILKHDQVLLQIFPRDFSFIDEDNLHVIFGCFANNHLRINLMQNSAVKFRVCVNNDNMRLPLVLEALKQNFDVTCEYNVTLITIRYYNDETIANMLNGKQLLLEQKNSNTVQMVVK